MRIAGKIKAREMFGRKGRKGHAERETLLLLHPSEDFIVILVDAAGAARVGIAVILFIGKVIVVHVDVLGLAVVAVAVAMLDCCAVTVVLPDKERVWKSRNLAGSGGTGGTSGGRATGPVLGVP